MRRGHFSIPYNGHRVQPIENDFRKRTAKVPPTNKLYIMLRFVQHLGGGRWPFVPCSQCKGVLNSARLIQIRSRSSVTFQSRFWGSFRCIFDWSQPAFASCFMLLTQTSELSYEATVQCASQGPIYAVLFLCEIANYTLSRRRQLADVYVLCACTKKSFRTRIHIAPLLFFVFAWAAPSGKRGETTLRENLWEWDNLSTWDKWPAPFLKFYCIYTRFRDSSSTLSV